MEAGDVALSFLPKTGVCWGGGVKCLILVILDVPAWIWGRHPTDAFLWRSEDAGGGIGSTDPSLIGKHLWTF